MCCPRKRLVNKGTPRDLVDVTLGTLASPIRSDGKTCERTSV